MVFKRKEVAREEEYDSEETEKEIEDAKERLRNISNPPRPTAHQEEVTEKPELHKAGDIEPIGEQTGFKVYDDEGNVHEFPLALKGVATAFARLFKAL